MLRTSIKSKHFLVHIPTTRNVEAAGSYSSDHGLSFSRSINVENNNKSTAAHTESRRLTVPVAYQVSHCCMHTCLVDLRTCKVSSFHTSVLGQSTYQVYIELSHQYSLHQHLFSPHSFPLTRTKFKRIGSSCGAPIILYSFVFFHRDAVLVKLARFIATGYI